IYGAFEGPMKRSRHASVRSGRTDKIAKKETGTLTMEKAGNKPVTRCHSDHSGRLAGGTTAPHPQLYAFSPATTASKHQLAPARRQISQRRIRGQTKVPRNSRVSQNSQVFCFGAKKA
ncbi:hypothetical protein HK096_003048, partial [Nowakowskiella sp. JEL0078]